VDIINVVRRVIGKIPWYERANAATAQTTASVLEDDEREQTCSTTSSTCELKTTIVPASVDDSDW
jgi:hypothetical protein